MELNMRTKIFVFIVGLLLTVWLALPATAADVAQGKCLSYDDQKKQLTIQEYDTRFSKEHQYGMPTGENTSFDTSEALIGITPEPGDIVRIAYNKKGKIRQAIRIMNVSRQDLRKK